MELDGHHHQLRELSAHDGKAVCTQLCTRPEKGTAGFRKLDQHPTVVARLITMFAESGPLKREPKISAV